MNNSIFPRMHVSLYVSDLEASRKFYTTFFGQEPVKVKPGYAKYVLEKPSLIISFVEHADRVGAGFGHLGFQVETPEELEIRLAAARKSGLVALEETGTACCYAVQDKFWAMDPDGYRWEVYYFHQDAEFNDPRYQTEAEACCSPQMVTQPDKTVVKQRIALKNLNTAPKGEVCCDPQTGCC
ncbi:MAG: VOC family protein [Bacteroidia bacterium]|nr:VOC family protein [Bacteroidia bacterium]